MRERAPLIIALTLCAGLAQAQSQTFELDDTGDWIQTAEPEPGSPEAIIGEARRLLADGKPGRARDLVGKWIEDNEFSGSPWLPEAYLVRADAKNEAGNEYKALYDYETVILEYPGSEAFAIAVERELDIGMRYLNGLRRKWLGLRIENSTTVGQELLVRVQERMPGSRLAERAGIELADYYYRIGDMKLAAEAYEIFLVNYPNSQYRKRAMQQQIYASIARYKGPDYDATPLVEASYLIEDFVAQYPADAERAGISEALVTRIDESRAASRLENAEWYLYVGDEDSARFTLERMIENYPSTVAASKARQIFEERGWLDESPPIDFPDDEEVVDEIREQLEEQEAEGIEPPSQPESIGDDFSPRTRRDEPVSRAPQAQPTGSGDEFSPRIRRDEPVTQPESIGDDFTPRTRREQPVQPPEPVREAPPTPPGVQEIPTNDRAPQASPPSEPMTPRQSSAAPVRAAPAPVREDDAVAARPARPLPPSVQEIDTAPLASIDTEPRTPRTPRPTLTSQGMSPAEQINSIDPLKPLPPSDLAARAERRGDALTKAGNYTGAYDAYVEGVSYRRRALQTSPVRDVSEANLADSLLKLGSAQSSIGRSFGSLDSFVEARDLYADLAARRPTDPTPLRGMLVAENEIARAQRALGEDEAALESTRRVMRINERLRELGKRGSASPAELIDDAERSGGSR